MQASTTETASTLPIKTVGVDSQIQLSETLKMAQISDIFSRLKIDQPEKGYRFSVDPVLLVKSVMPKEGEQILDIGTGCGIIPLLLASKYPTIQMTAVEIQKELAEIAHRNIEANHLTKRIRLINKDIRGLNSSETNGRFDRVISNPPYKKKGSGRLNPDFQKAVARHEITLILEELILCATRFLKKNGILNLIYPSGRLEELLHTMNRHSIKPSDIRYVHTGKGVSPKLVLVTGINIFDPSIVES